MIDDETRAKREPIADYEFTNDVLDALSGLLLIDRVYRIVPYPPCDVPKHFVVQHSRYVRLREPRTTKTLCEAFGISSDRANGKSIFFEIGVAWLGEAQGTSMTLRFHPLLDLSRIAPGSYVYVKPRNTRAK